MARPWSPWIAVVIGLILTLPALRGGLLGDDYVHRSILLGVGNVGAQARPLLDLFAFVPEGPRHKEALELGTLTWWAHPQLKVHLLRPVASLTHLLDYALWPDSFALQHLHSLLWYALAVFTVASFYRRVHGATVVAGLAAIFFAVEDAHALCAGWLANRHALVSLVVGMLALHAHHRWRRGQGTGWAVAAVCALAVALLCSEAALGAAAYIVAWELTMEDSPWPRRLAALLPYGLVVAAWRVMYSALGYGTNGSGLYVDPGLHPIGFLVALAERWPILQLAQWFQAPVDLFLLLPRGAQVGLVALSVLACAILLRAFLPLLVGSRRARFWALGMSLSLVPLCAAFPMNRLLLFSGVGAFPLLALLIQRTSLLSGRGPESARGRTLAAFLLVLHGPLAAVLLLVTVGALPLFAGAFEHGHLTAPTDGDPPGRTFVFVTGQEFPVVYLAIIRQLEAPAVAPRRVALLSSISSRNTAYREDRDTLVVVAEAGFLRASVDRLERSLDLPFQVGERIERPDFTAEVRALTADGRPLEVAFHFHAPLESPEYRWLAWGRNGAQEFALPEVGESVEIPAVSVLTGFAPH